MQLLALEKATALLLDIVGGVAGPVCSAMQPEALPSNNTVLFNPLRVKQITGLKISETEMAAMLERLEMKVDKNVSPWKVKIPSHRFDISLDVDLVEEIARLNGYDKLSGSTMLAAVQVGQINPVESLATRISQLFVSRGYHETISYSFVDPELQEELYPQQPTMQLLNPISSELSHMRAGMWPGLLASMIYNIHRQQTAIKFFELGVIFELRKEVLHEHPCIAGLLTGEYGALNWGEKSGKFDFYDLKGDLQALFAFLHIDDVKFEAEKHPALHPGKSARITIENQDAGWCGVLHPRIADALDIHEEVILFELRLNALVKEATPRYRQISKFPQIRRDLSMLVNNEITAAQIESAVYEVAGAEYLRSFDVFDVYTGEHIPEGKKVWLLP